MWRILHALGVLSSLADDLLHGGDELVERFAGLRFRRLDHDGAADDQREIDRGRVETVVEKPFGEVERLDSERLERRVREDALVETWTMIGELEHTREAFADVVGIEDRHLG